MTALQADHDVVHKVFFSFFSVRHVRFSLQDQVIADERIGFVSFTGSVDGGHKVSHHLHPFSLSEYRLEVYESVAKRFIDATLELGGKDPAYVAPDANLQFGWTIDSFDTSDAFQTETQYGVLLSSDLTFFSCGGID